MALAKTIKCYSTQKLYDEFLKFFDVRELVSEQVYETFKHYGEYYFLSRFDRRILETVLFIRKRKGKAITINNWLWGGRFEQRGLRENVSDIVRRKTSQNQAYLSAHPLSMGVDYDIEGETASEHREWIKEVQNELPHPIRLERNLNGEPITWVHLDVCADPRNSTVYEFDV